MSRRWKNLFKGKKKKGKVRQKSKNFKKGGKQRKHKTKVTKKISGVQNLRKSETVKYEKKKRESDIRGKWYKMEERKKNVYFLF